jgi:hypothetical protein
MKEVWVRATTGLTKDNDFYPVEVVNQALKNAGYETRITGDVVEFKLREGEINEFRRLSKSQGEKEGEINTSTNNDNPRRAFPIQLTIEDYGV